jgi:hypothetical protein
MKTVGGLRRTRYRGRERVQMHAYLVAAAYNPRANRPARPGVHLKRPGNSAPRPPDEAQPRPGQALDRSLVTPRNSLRLAQ